MDCCSCLCDIVSIRSNEPLRYRHNQHTHTIAQHVHKKENGNKNKLVDKRTRQGCKQHYHMINKHVNNNSITIIILNDDLSL